MPQNFDFEVPFPDYSVERIVFEEKKVTLLCSMMRPRNQNNSSWFLSSRFHQYIKVFFVVSEKLSEEQLIKYNYPQFRVSEWSSALEVPLESWEACTEINEGSNGRPAIFGRTITSLEELVQQKQLLQQNLYASINDDAVTQENIVGSISSDHYFEVEVDFPSIEKLDLDAYSSSSLDVFSFMHIDVERMKEDFNLGVNAGEIIGIGGRFKYDKCLRKVDEDMPSERLEVIENVNALFRENGSAYSGMAHYHRDEDGERGPGGYVGWMSGPGPGLGFPGVVEEMENRERLTARPVKNTKVVYNLVHNPLDYTGQSLLGNRNLQNTYDGYEIGQSFGLGLLAPVNTPHVSLGEELIAHVRAQIGQIGMVGDIGTSIYREKLENAAIGSIRNSKFSVMDTSVDPDLLSSLITEPFTDRTHYLSIMTINCDDVLMHNSRFGHIFRNIMENTLPEISNPILDDMIALCEISDFTVKRRRVTRMPLSNNFSSTGKREEYDSDEPRKLMIYCPGDSEPDNVRAGFSIATRENQRCSISQSQSPDRLKRVYQFKDYDLWENIDYGTYEYIVSINFKDGVREYLVSLYQEYSRFLAEYLDFVKEASIPYLDYRNSDYYQGHQFEDLFAERVAQRQFRSSGNYIIGQDRFTREFAQAKNRGDLPPQSVENIVNVYLRTLIILGITPFSLSLLDPNAAVQQEDMRTLLLEKLKVNKATLKTYEFFYELFSYTLKVLEKVTFLRKYSRYSQLNFDSSSKSLKSTIDVPSNQVSLEAPCNASVNTIPKNAILVEPAIPIVGDVVEIPGAFSPNAGLGAVFSIRNFRGGLNSDNPNFRAISGNRIEIVSPVEVFDGSVSRADAEARIFAAIEASTVGSIDIPGRELMRDPLKLFNNTMASQGGITFESMATKIMVIREDETTSEKNNHMNVDMQKTLLTEILNSESGEDFEKRIDDVYKDYYYTKEGLGTLFDTVKSVMTIAKVSQKISTKSTFKDIVMSGDTESDYRHNQRDRRNSARTSIMDIGFVLSKYVIGSGLQISGADSNIGIYIPESKLPAGLHLVNKIVVSSGSLNGAVAQSNSPTRRASTSATTPTGTGAQTSGRTTSSNYGGGGSSY